jgi:general secretion pathway protein M
MVKLAKREKYLVSFAACAIGMFLLLQFLIFPFFEEKKRIQRGIRAREEGLEEIVRLRAEYQVHKKGFQGIKQILARRKKGFTLFSFLEKAAGEAELKGHIKYMKPSSSQGTGPYKESMVEMKLEGITLNQLVGYLYRIESPENIIIVQFSSVNLEP